MAADILLYKTNAVPVGLDQAPHIEFAREIVRSFNHHYKTQVLIEPEMKVTQFPKVLGTDGHQKMSKSLNNHIELAATPEETEKRVLTMVTDPARIRRTDPGNPDICNVFTFHNMFSPKETIDMVNIECRRAGIGCVEDKHLMAKFLNEYLAPFRARRHELEKDPNYVWDVLRDGEKRAKAIAEKTLEEIRAAVGLP
jgi:tryptophanyl-tRNA synthetase